MPTFSSALVLFSSTKPHAPKHLKDTCSRLAARPVKTVLILNTTVRGAADRATLEELSRPWTPRCGFKRHLEERRLFLQETTSERELQFAAANTTSTSSRYTQARRQHRAVLITTHTHRAGDGWLISRLEHQAPISKDEWNEGNTTKTTILLYIFIPPSFHPSLSLFHLLALTPHFLFAFSLSLSLIPTQKKEI